MLLPVGRALLDREGWACLTPGAYDAIFVMGGSPLYSPEPERPQNGKSVMAGSLLAAVPSGLEDRTRRKIALRLLPFLFLLYIVNYVDRTNLGFAAMGMARDLGFSDRVFGLGAGIFFASYMALQVPGALLVEKWSARRVISGCMVTWGMLTVLTGLVETPWQLYAARLVLGAAEASFFPGVIVYLSHWFQTTDRAKATSNFMAAIPISFVIGSPIAGWIISHHWLGVSG